MHIDYLLKNLFLQHLNSLDILFLNKYDLPKEIKRAPAKKDSQLFAKHFQTGIFLDKSLIVNIEYCALKTHCFLKQEWKRSGQKATGSSATSAFEELTHSN